MQVRNILLSKEIVEMLMVIFCTNRDGQNIRKIDPVIVCIIRQPDL